MTIYKPFAGSGVDFVTKKYLHKRDRGRYNLFRVEVI